MNEKTYDIRELLEIIREKTAYIFASFGFRISIISDMNADFFCKLDGRNFIFMLFHIFDMFFRAGVGKNIFIKTARDKSDIKINFCAPFDLYEKFDGFVKENFYDFALLDELCKINGGIIDTFEAVGENLVCDIRMPVADKICASLSNNLSDETDMIIAKEAIYFI